ncbi:MAG: hypothetical protein A2Z31_05665 [candidate division NC10 bacterium RBG_16_65_8]|nr:MAG: hypothetical protein A2Z31_05665 [candidate division NC10 bacterium RBG_16_65_8]
MAIDQDTTRPNGDIGMDAVRDSMIHELAETTTDPDGDTWYTLSGSENVDLGSFVDGPTFLAPNGSQANVTLGTRNSLVQDIWDRVGAFGSQGN